MRRRLPELLILGLLVTACLPAAAQDSCGKLYQNEDCGLTDFQAAADRMRAEAEKRAAAQATTGAARSDDGRTVPAPTPQGAGRTLKDAAMDAYRARASALAPPGAMQCCHPAVGGGMWCH